MYRVIARDENVIRNSRIAGFVYRFDAPSRCHIVRLNSYRSFCFYLLDIFSLTEGTKYVRSENQFPLQQGIKTLKKL